MKVNDSIFREAKRIHDLGGAILWLHPKSKRPVENGWTSGPRKEWAELKRSYQPGYNVGVRPGEVSRIGKRGYLAVIDVDIKDPTYKKAALTRLKELIGSAQSPEERSGCGNVSRNI